MSPDVAAIERRRRAAGLTIEELARRAEISVSTYVRFKKGSAPRARSLAKLKRALLMKERHREAALLAPEAAFRSAISAICAEQGLNAHAVLDADPQRKATADAAWMAAIKVRRIALHVLNGGAGMRTQALAEAAGVTPAAVLLAVRDIEDMRDHDPALDDLLNRMHAVFNGGQDWCAS